jgi:hypothetical protein
MPIRDQMIDRADSLWIGEDKSGGASTTLSAGATAGATTLAVGSIAGISTGMVLRVGGEDAMELVQVNGTPSAGNVPLASPGLQRDHASGEAVVEQIVYDLGDAADIMAEHSAQQTSIPVATSPLPFGTLAGYTEQGVKFSIPTQTIHQIALALGIPTARVLGAGTLADPTQLFTDGSDFSTATRWAHAAAVREDGSIVRVLFPACQSDHTVHGFKIAQGTPAPTPVKLVAGAEPAYFNGAWNATPPLSLLLRATKGKLIERLVEVGLIVDDAILSTTVANAAAKDAQSLTLASGTGAAAGQWLRLSGPGRRDDLVFMNAPSGAVMSLRTRLGYAAAVGDLAVVQKLVPFGGCAEEGIDFQTGGEVAAIRLGTKRGQVAIKNRRAEGRLSFMVVDFTLDNIRQALGLPTGNLSGSRLKVDTSLFTNYVNGVYVKGLYKDGSTFWTVLAGADAIAQALSLAFTNADIAKLPLAYQANSAMRFLAHP